MKEQVNHACIAVEKAPASEILRSRGSSSPTVAAFEQSASAYNAEQSGKDEYLETCFQKPYADVRHKLLAHCHMMMVLRAFRSQAKWDLPANAEKNIVFCDADGRLSVSAVAASPLGKQLAEVLAEGVLTEVLSWKMDVEEPDAAAIISEAQNLSNHMSMRTSELTAVAVSK